MAHQLSRVAARKLYSLGAGGSLRSLGSGYTKSNWFSTQEFNDASRDTESESNTQVSEFNRDQFDASSDSFSFNSTTPRESLVGGEQSDQSAIRPSDNYLSGRAYQPRGVYKAILLGEVGQAPAQKILKSGRAVTVFSVGTGGMHLNRRMFDGETPEEFAERSNMQWHRVAVYQEKVGNLILRSMKQGAQVYVEGNMETRVYTDPVTQQVKRIREIAVRQNGRLLFMDAASADKDLQFSENSLDSVEPITHHSGSSEQSLGV